jgi:hypothetical protein
MFAGETGSWQLTPGCYDLRVLPSETGLDYLYINGVQVQAGQTASVTVSAFPTSQ